MEIFISWSGARSKTVAEALRNWLPKVNPAFKPWLSSADIDKGARWAEDVSSRLEAATIGIFCLTPGNLHNDWILFEAGAISKVKDTSYVCTLLIDLEPSDIKPPLSSFQATKCNKTELYALLETLNSKLGELAHSDLKEAFNTWWPKLEQELAHLPSETTVSAPQRSDRELLEELLALTRNLNRVVPSLITFPPELTQSERRIFSSAILETINDKYKMPVQHITSDHNTFHVLLQDGLAFPVPVEAGMEPNEVRIMAALSMTRAIAKKEAKDKAWDETLRAEKEASEKLAQSREA